MYYCVGCKICLNYSCGPNKRENPAVEWFYLKFREILKILFIHDFHL